MKMTTHKNTLSEIETRRQPLITSERVNIEEQNAELTWKELENVSGGSVFRITNVRVNATSLGGGSAAGALAVLP